MRFLTVPVTLIYLIVTVHAQQSFRVGKDLSPNLVFTSFEYPGNVLQRATGINASGDVVGWWFDDISGRIRGYLYGQGAFTDFDIPVTDGVWGYGINDAGVIVGAAAFQSSSQGYTLTNGQYRRVHCAGYSNSEATGINRQGDVVGDCWRSGHYTHGFLLHRGNYVAIEYPDSVSTSVYGINAKGAVVGSFALNSNVGGGYLLEDGTYTVIDFPGATFSYPTGISGTGVIVGNYQDNPEYGGYVLQNGVFHKVLVPGAIFTYVFGINDQNVIVGSYEDSSLTWHGFTAHK